MPPRPSRPLRGPRGSPARSITFRTASEPAPPVTVSVPRGRPIDAEFGVLPIRPNVWRLGAGVKHRLVDENGGFRELVGTELSSAGEERAPVNPRGDARHLYPNGTVHGGAVSTLIDVSLAEALNTMVGEGEGPVTIEIKVNYLEPGRPGTLISTAEVRKGGKRVTIVEAEVSQEESGEVVALAIGTYTLVG